MRTTWLVGFPMLWILGQFVSNTINMEYLGAGSTNIIWALIMGVEFTETAGGTGIFGFFTTAWDWIEGLLEIIAWDYAFFDGVFFPLRVFFCCLSVAWVVSLVLAVRGTGSG